MSPENPTPIADLDAALALTLKRSRRDRWFIAAVVVVCLGAVGWLLIQRSNDQARTNHEIVAELNRASAGECQFFQTLGNTPPAANVTKLGVEILVEARASFADLGCTGYLDPPSRALIVAARSFGVTVSH